VCVCVCVWLLRLVFFAKVAKIGHWTKATNLYCNLAVLAVKERTKKMLVEHGIHLEDFGGNVQAVCISALKVCHSCIVNC